MAIDLSNYSHPENFNINDRGNRSNTYVLPMLGGLESNYRGTKFPQSQYKGCFLGDKVQEGYESNQIMLLYRLPFQSSENVDNWTSFETFNLMGSKYFRGDYKADKHHQMYVFDIPEQWKKDYNLFLEWAPSKFTDAYKRQMLIFYNVEKNGGVLNPLYQVLYKNSKHGEQRFLELETLLNCSIPREQENSSSPYWEIEYFQEKYKYKETFEKINDGESTD